MPGSDVFAFRSDSAIQIAPAPMRLRWELTELVTSDGHVARGIFWATVRALPDANELRMLEEALLSSRSSISSADVVDHFSPAILSAARKSAAESNAKALLEEAGRRTLA